MTARALFDAIEMNDVHEVRDILRSNTDLDINVLNQYDDTPLIVAVKRGYVDIVKELLKNYPTRENLDLNVLDGEDGRNVLTLAVQRNNLKLVKLLLEAGIDPDLENDDENTTLIEATTYGNPAIIKLLLQYGANVNYQGFAGRTPLMVASLKRKPDLRTIQLLLEAGANPDIQLLNGDTALTIVTNNLRNNERLYQRYKNRIDELYENLQEYTGTNRRQARKELNGLMESIQIVKEEIENQIAIIELLRGANQIASPIQYRGQYGDVELSGRTGRRGGHVLHYSEK